MDRRTFLVVLAAGAAGCTGDEGTATEKATPSPTRPPTATATATETPTATATETPTATDEQGAAQGANENDGENTPETTETETETATPSDEERAANHIATAEEHLRAAVETYVGAAEAGTWLAVDGSHDIDDRRIESELRTADDELQTAAIHATDEQAELVASLQHLVRYVGLVADVHVGLHDAWVAVRQGLAAARKEAFEEAATAVEEAEAAVAEAEEGIATLRDDARPIATEATSALSREAYKGKIDALEAERATAEHLSRVPGEIEDGLVEFADASADFMDERYDQAAVKYWAAWKAFEDGLEHLPEEPPGAYERVVAALKCFLGALYEASRNLETASKHGRNVDKERAALDALESCDLVTGSPSAVEMRDWLRDEGR